MESVSSTPTLEFGDPETQVVLPLLKTDLLEIMLATAEDRLSEMEIEWSDGHACCVMVVSGGYPEAYGKGKPISLGDGESMGTLYHSGTVIVDGKLVTAGGRVIGAVATGTSLQQAIDNAYRAASEICFEGAYMRRDIGQKALMAQ